MFAVTAGNAKSCGQLILKLLPLLVLALLYGVVNGFRSDRSRLPMVLKLLLKKLHELLFRFLTFLGLQTVFPFVLKILEAVHNCGTTVLNTVGNDGREADVHVTLWLHSALLKLRIQWMRR